MCSCAASTSTTYTVTASTRRRSPSCRRHSRPGPPCTRRRGCRHRGWRMRRSPRSSCLFRGRRNQRRGIRQEMETAMTTTRNNEAFATRVVLETVWDEICHNARQSRELVQTKLLADVIREAYAMTMYLTEREWDELQNNTRCI
jgi:hypothetical protein